MRSVRNCRERLGLLGPVLALALVVAVASLLALTGPFQKSSRERPTASVTTTRTVEVVLPLTTDPGGRQLP